MCNHVIATEKDLHSMQGLSLINGKRYEITGKQIEDLRAVIMTMQHRYAVPALAELDKLPQISDCEYLD